MDKKLLYGTAGLILIGMVMVYSSSCVMADSRFGSQFYFVKRQAMWLMLALLIGWGVYRLDLKKLSVYSVPALVVMLALLALVFVMPARNGSHRWIFLGPFSLQPSEIFKLIVLYYLAFSLSQKQRDITDFRQILYPYVPLIGGGLLLIIFEPGLGSALTIGLSILVVFFLAGMRLLHLAALTVPLMAIVSFLVFVIGYKKARVMDYLAAIQDPLSGSYQVKQAVLTLGAGQIVGTGVADGHQKLFFLPYPHTDFIFATIGEELGFIGLMVILALFYVIIWRGWRITMYQPDRFGYLLGAGITATIFVAVIINVGVVTSLFPTTGIPLPFLSYGGTSLLVSIVSVAILFNLSRRKGVRVR